MARSRKTPFRTTSLTVPAKAGFDEVLLLLDDAGNRGQGTVSTLAECIRKQQPTPRGFLASHLWRRTQFYQTYRGLPKLAPLSRELSWSHKLAILSRRLAAP